MKKPAPAPVKVVADILNPDWQYIPANKTNVADTWRKFGWLPPSKTKRLTNQNNKIFS